MCKAKVSSGFYMMRTLNLNGLINRVLMKTDLSFAESLQVFAWTAKWHMQLLSYRDLHLIQRTEIDISLKRILKSSTTATYESSVKTFQKSDTSTFHSPFTLSKKSGWPNKATWFLLKGLNDLGTAHLIAVLLTLLKNLTNFFSKINEEKLKKNLKRQKTILFGSSSIIWVHFILLTSIRVFKKYLTLSYFSIYANSFKESDNTCWGKKCKQRRTEDVIHMDERIKGYWDKG